MDKLLGTLVASEPFERILLAQERPIRARADAGRGFLIAGLSHALEASVLAVTPGPREAEDLASEVRAFMSPQRVQSLPAWEALAYESISPSPDVAARRGEALRLLRASSGPFVLVAPALAAMQGLIPTLGGVEAIEVAAGSEFAPDQLARRLIQIGYRRTDVVVQRGEFAVRGGVVDVFAGTATRPVRLEYWGDEIESVREFVPSTQRSTSRVASARIPPVRELVADEELRNKASLIAPRFTERFRDPLQRLADGLDAEGIESLAPLLFESMPTPAQVMLGGSWVVVTDEQRTFDRAHQAFTEAEAVADALEWPAHRPIKRLDEALGSHARLHLTGFTEGTQLGLESWGTAEGNPPELSERLRRLEGAGFQIVLVGRGHGSLARMREVVGDLTHETIEAALPRGFLFEAGKLAVATEEDLFGTRRHTRTVPRFTSRRTDAVAEELEQGDFAVHRIHGVGRYAGITHRALAGAERDYLVLEYAKGDRLFVPSDQVGMVARYVGGDVPRVHRLGGSDWARATQKVRRSVRDMAGELVRLYTVRMQVPGHSFGSDTHWQQELEDAFPHDETPDQVRVVDEVKADMESGRPMDRLICGDVGFGKTEIAVRGAFKAVMDGKQVAVLVPTTLLAEQHYITFSERLAPFPVKIAMLSRFVSQAEQRRIVEEVAAGAIDIVIGTHRLLGADVRFKDLGLLVVDEEQRFGVAHKERLKTLRAHVDVLSMTATPIPRTMEMALTGIRSMSTIDTPPEDRQPVLTYVGRYDDGLALGAVRRELLREGQVFWVHNRVATIDRQAGWLREQLPEARIAVAHGQMDESLLEQEMISFWNGEVDLLLSTVIIESGLDVPNANTLVVDRADTLGLAQLYQLRGRVGRSSERAFAYFFFPPQREMTEEAAQRLETIAKYQALGSGFHIALRDLEIRGAGNLLGAEQHGHIAAVGFDAYARILREAVSELKGEQIPQEKELRIDLPVKAFIPPGWVSQESLRLELYRRISLAADHVALRAILEETVDRYGALPEQMQTLFAIASLRLTASRLGIEEISTFKQQVRLTPVLLSDRLRLDLAERVEGASFHEARRTLNIVPGRVFGQDLVRLVEAKLRSSLGEPAEPGLELLEPQPAA